MSLARFSVVCSHQTNGLNSNIILKDEVKAALIQNRPVVALESTIISHGMPYPQNKSTAQKVEQVVRENGCVPATIAILKGKIYVGLTDEQMETLALPTTTVKKCSRRDIAYVLALGGNGSTTVAATMLIAHLVGIKVFVTGGIGGVHRGAEKTMDISADLLELGQTPVCVVSAGVKSILDIPKTLEVLETQGVTVIGYGSDEFPAFFTSKSGCPSPMRLDTPYQCAKMLQASQQLGLRNGTLIAVPIPKELEADSKKIQQAIQSALEEADTKGIHGHEITPFLLGRINELTKGESLESNVGLILNNAKIGSQIAYSLSTLN